MSNLEKILGHLGSAMKPARPNGRSSSAKGKGKKKSQPKRSKSSHSSRQARVGVKDGQVSKPSPVPKGDPVAANARKANQYASHNARIDYNDAVVRSLTANPKDVKEEILGVVNYNILQAYVMGCILRPTGVSDDPAVLSTALCVATTICLYFEQLPEYFAEIPLPKAIVRLRKALTSRTVGDYVYTPDWSSVALQTVDNTNGVAAAGLTINNSGQDYPLYSSTVTAGGFNGVVFTQPPGSLSYITRFLASYADFYDLVSYHSYVDDVKDASAFAFDIDGCSGIKQGTSSLMLCHSGYDQDGLPVYLKQNGIYGLEVKPRRTDLASIRLCSPAPRAFGSGLGTYTSLRFTRRPLHTGTPYGLPSVLGWNSGPMGIKGRIQLKPVGGLRLLNAVIGRLEALASSLVSNSPYATAAQQWWSAQTPNMVRLLVYGWWRNYIRQYSGCYFGTNFLQTNGSNSVETYTAYRNTAPEYHANVFCHRICRMPEYVTRLFAAISPTSNADGTILPWFATLTLNQLVTSGTYATETITLPTSQVECNYSYTLPMLLCAKYKTFEPIFSSQENLPVFGEPFKSHMATTVLLTKDTTAIKGFASRRILDNSSVYDVLLCLPAITYDYVESLNAVLNLGYPFARASSTATASHEYAQHCRFEFSGDILTLIAMFKTEGIVANGFTSNIGDSSTSTATNSQRVVVSGGGLPLAKPVPLKVATVPKEAAGFVQRLASRLVPRAGKYCGPMWTAGIDTADVDPEMKADEYQVVPDSKEDAVCKRHDEAYAKAGGDSDKVYAADEKMVQELDDLRAKEGLSLYGHAARLAIKSKMAMSRLL